MAKAHPRSKDALLGEIDAAAMQWSEVSRKYTGPLTGFFAKRIDDLSEVGDLVQEVFCHLLSRKKGAVIERPEQYLFQTAANVLKDRARRRRARFQDAHELFDDAAHPGSEISPERVYIGIESVKRLTAALRELPERTRDIFVLRALEKRRYVEIARMMKISTRAAEKHMAKALAHVGRALDNGQ